MTNIIKGAEIAATIRNRLKIKLEKLEYKGVVPTLAIVRVGEDESQISYERGAGRCCKVVGITVGNIVLPADISMEELIKQIRIQNADVGVHAVLLMRPLPRQINEDEVRSVLASEKDVDGITDQSLADVMTGRIKAFPPCTAQACLEVLDHIGIDVKGKHMTIVGSSLVVGKPLGMMLLNRFATVTLCHIHTRDVPKECRNADIIIAAAGCRGLIRETYVKSGQTVLDVGINLDENGKIHGDVDAASVEGIAGILTAVPGGIGTITTAVLAEHVVDAAVWQTE